MYAVIYNHEQKSIGIVNNIQGISHKDESTIIHSKDVNTLTIRHGKVYIYNDNNKLISCYKSNTGFIYRIKKFFKLI